MERSCRVPALLEMPGVYPRVFDHERREWRCVGEAASLAQRVDSCRAPGRERGIPLRMKDRSQRVLTTRRRQSSEGASESKRDGQILAADSGSK